ncbi:MAG: hypothetical protein WCF90_02585 [Methanomicrobiales archaeon]
MSSVKVVNDPVWTDRDVVIIKPTDTFYDNTKLRWISLDKDATAFYQVSRKPFSDNVHGWQNQYMPVLVASGLAMVVYLDKECFHYFFLNFAPVATHDTAQP